MRSQHSAADRLHFLDMGCQENVLDQLLAEDRSIQRLRDCNTYQQDIIVDGLWDADNTTCNILLCAFDLNGVGTSIAAVATHHKDHVQAPHVYPLDNLSAVQPPYLQKSLQQKVI